MFVSHMSRKSPLQGYEQEGFSIKLASKQSFEQRQRLASAHFRDVRSCLAVHSDAVDICTDTASIALETLRAKSDSGASLQLNRGPMALPY
jgi:hypothetical protein